MKRFIIRCCQAVFGISLVIALVAAAGYGMGSKTVASAVSSVTHSGGTHTTTAATAAKSQAARQTFMNTITAAAENYPDVETGVSLIDLDSGTQLDAGENVAFTAASTTKVLTAAAYMRSVDQGTASLSTLIAGTSAKVLLQRMLNLSDNDAWAALNSYIGKDVLKNYATTLGLTSYDPYTNIITPHDEAVLMAVLADNKLTTSEHTNLLLSYMHNTNNEDLIPAALPTGATIYHKYGYLGGELHDAAIITYEGHHFVLVIFTKNDNNSLEDYAERTQLFHKITDAAIEYITS